jgi:DNA-binding CsgD family transcriptional regulator
MPAIRRARHTTRLSRAGSSAILPKRRCMPPGSAKHERAWHRSKPHPATFREPASPWGCGARALLAQDPEEAAARFDEAFGADLSHWPLQRARLLLAYGQWLRCQRRIAESRTPLRDARDAFDAMGCAAWGDQARRELRASGESSRRRDLAASDRLTAQELQIAQLAAQGLSNRDIAQRLYLSHRTIGTHLYRIFPKLGITSRGELRSALSSSAALGKR